MARACMHTVLRRSADACLIVPIFADHPGGAARCHAVRVVRAGLPLWPRRAARTRFLTHLLACPVSDREPFFLQTPVGRSERLAIGWAVRAPFPSGPALHPEVRFAWELGWLP